MKLLFVINWCVRNPSQGCETSGSVTVIVKIVRGVENTKLDTMSVLKSCQIVPLHYTQSVWEIDSGVIVTLKLYNT